MASHRKNKTRSNLEKHEKGITRKMKDRGGEKGDMRRREKANKKKRKNKTKKLRR